MWMGDEEMEWRNVGVKNGEEEIWRE